MKKENGTKIETKQTESNENPNTDANFSKQKHCSSYLIKVKKILPLSQGDQINFSESSHAWTVFEWMWM